MPHNDTIVMLMATMTANSAYRTNQERAINLFRAKDIPLNVVDATAVENRETRAVMFKLSGTRGVYPQFFLTKSNEDEEESGAPSTASTISIEQLEYVGDWETIEALNEASSLPDHVLASHPEIKTWERILAV